MLRDYQVKDVSDIRAEFTKGHQAICYALSTGGGKTVVFSHIVEQAVRNGWPTMVLCDRKELIDQAAKKIKVSGIKPILINPSYRGQRGMCYVASVDTLRNRELPDIKLLIIDEAHMRSFDPIVLQYKAKGVLIIGVTATPVRSGKKFFKKESYLDLKYPDYTGQMGDVYDTLVCNTDIKNLIENGWLVPCFTFGPEADLKNISKRGDDFDERELFEQFNKPKFYEGVVDNYLKFAKDKKAICFCINREHGLKTADAFKAQGISCEFVDATTHKDERPAIFARFGSGVTQVLCNVGVAVKGYDEPSIECVILNLATLSLSKYLQMLGRGSRLCEAINKAFFIVIDQGSHIPRLGYYDQVREWSLDKRFISKDPGVGPIKYCADCEAIMPMSASVCKFCNTQFPVTSMSNRVGLSSEFTLIDSVQLNKKVIDMSVQELEAYRAEKKHTIAWVVNQLMPRGRETLQEYARLKNYQPAWAEKQIELAEEKRINTISELNIFMRKNQHVDDEFIHDYAKRKLSKTHSKREVEALLPKIITQFSEIKLGLIH